MSTTLHLETDAEINEGCSETLYSPTYYPGTYLNWVGSLGHIDIYGYIFNYNAFVRFDNVVIPSGIVIIEAYIQFYGANYTPPSVGTTTGTIYGIDEDDTADLSTDPSGRSSTTANIAFSFTNWTKLVANNYSLTGNLKTIVQEIIDRDGWVSGNALGFKFINSSGGDNMVNFAGNDTYYGGSTYDPELTVIWKYKDSGIRIFKSTGNINIGSSKDGALRIKTSSGIVNIPLINTEDPDACGLRIYDGSNIKTIPLVPDDLTNWCADASTTKNITCVNDHDTGYSGAAENLYDNDVSTSYGFTVYKGGSGDHQFDGYVEFEAVFDSPKNLTQIMYKGHAHGTGNGEYGDGYALYYVYADYGAGYVTLWSGSVGNKQVLDIYDTKYGTWNSVEKLKFYIETSADGDMDMEIVAYMYEMKAF